MSLGDPDPLWFQTVNHLIFENMLVTALKRESHCSSSGTYVTVLRKRGLLVGFAEFVFLVSLECASNAL